VVDGNDVEIRHRRLERGQHVRQRPQPCLPVPDDEVAPEPLRRQVLRGAVPASHRALLIEGGLDVGRRERPGHAVAHRREGGVQAFKVREGLGRLGSRALVRPAGRRRAVKAHCCGAPGVTFGPQRGDHAAERPSCDGGLGQAETAAGRFEITENRFPLPRTVSGAAVPAQVGRDDAELRGQFPGQRLHAHEVRARAVQEQERGTGSAEVTYRDLSARDKVLIPGHKSLLSRCGTL
jgi:hypothetical protein